MGGEDVLLQSRQAAPLIEAPQSPFSALNSGHFAAQLIIGLFCNLGITLLTLYLPNIDKGPIRWWSFDVNIPNVFSSMIVGGFLVGSITVFLSSGGIKQAAKEGQIPTINSELLLARKYTGRLLTIKRVNLRAAVFGICCTSFAAIPIISVGAIACAAQSSFVKLDDGDICAFDLRPFTAAFIVWSEALLAICITLNYLACLNSAGLEERPSVAPPKKARCGCGCSHYNCCYIVGVLFLFLGVAIPTIISSVEQELLISQAVVSAKSPNYLSWKEPGGSAAHPKMDWLLYNVSNPEGVFKGEKPKLQAVGPITYNYHEAKFDVAFDDEHNAVQYYSWFYFTYDAEANAENEKKGIHEDMVVTVINPSLLGVIAEIEGFLPKPVNSKMVGGRKHDGHQQEGSGPIAASRRLGGSILPPEPLNNATAVCNLINTPAEKTLCHLLFRALGVCKGCKGIEATAEGNKDTAYFVRRPFKELAFGYKNSQLMTMVHDLVHDVFPTIPCSTDYPGLQFNLSDHTAAAALGLNRAKTGAGNISQLGQYMWYRGNSLILPPDLGTPMPNPLSPPWGTDAANHIDGCSAGGMFPGGGGVSPGKPLKIFAMLLYRNIEMMVLDDFIDFKGVKLRRALFHPDVWSPTEENKRAYFNPPEPGMLNMSAIMYGLPMMVTRLHFMGVGKDNGVSYRKALSVDGKDMQPLKEEEYESYFDIHPELGVPFRNAQRLQLNFRIGPVEFSVNNTNIVFNTTSFLKPNLIPIGWSVVRSEMDDKVSGLLIDPIDPLDNVGSK
jgi:hypothetical protein